jgi:ribosome maturation factor RimP
VIALSQQEKTILALIEPVAEGLGMEIVRVRLMGGNRPILQIMAEKAGGAPTDVEDCANLSHGISPVLEATDPISDPFRLEVSTPGIDRPLTRRGDFGRWAGHLAKVELAMPISGRRRFHGVIQREDDRGVAIELDDESELVAQVEDMSKASLILTDALIDAAQKAGGLPPQPDDEGFSGLDVDDSEDDDSEVIKEENGATR